MCNIEKVAFSREENALLSFSMPKVQAFIASARTTKDLYCGSFLFSWLTLTAMQPILVQHGKSALLSPSLKYIPEEILQDPCLLESPCLPSTFLALVPAQNAETLAQECHDSLLNAWLGLAEKVRQELSVPSLKRMYPDWDKRWDVQVKNVFSPVKAVLPLQDCTSEALTLLSWPMQNEQRTVLEISEWLMQCQRQIVKVPHNCSVDPSERFPLKCTLLGTVEQVGPASFEDSAQFWKTASEEWKRRGVRLRRGERLSVVPLIKRAAWNHLVGNRRPAFPDTATVAARYWLKDVEIDYTQEQVWSGDWLHWSCRDQEEEAVPVNIWHKLESLHQNPLISKPPLYYAVLQGDGDFMSRWLRGDFHDKASDSIQIRTCISAALNDFAINHVPEIVKKHKGECIYAGGDDVLAVMPLTHAFTCAKKLQEAFRQCMSSVGGMREATFSMGLVAAHYKADLRRVLETARRTEKEAKTWGRDILMVRVCPRSGEELSMACPWNMAPVMEKVILAFRDGASDAFARQFGALDGSLDGLGREAVLTEMVRMFGRGEEKSRSLLTKALDGGMPDDAQVPRDVLWKFLETYIQETDCRYSAGSFSASPLSSRASVAERITAVWKIASFCARGRDQ